MAFAKRSQSGVVKSDLPVFPEGFGHLQGYLDANAQRALAARMEQIVAAAPLYRPAMPRTGEPFSIEMTNCGPLGWVADKHGGYRYQANHPITGKPWPAMPPELYDLWRTVTGSAALPEACLINHYTAGTKLGSHVDRDEEDLTVPVVSISLGDDAVFHIGGRSRSSSKRRLMLVSGDVVLLAGEARLAYHGIDRISPGTSDIVARGGRFNLTLRRVTPPPTRA